ncbi:MAG: cytochrome c biogenesis protein ResB, partial [Candidatus Riflebacteria bacterium]|nr:cytochrome c biogenesis protein ResB [Candidatus Riflebacteria bacterium]
MNKLIQILVSLKTAVFIIAIISVLSVIGTLVPQKLEAAAYLTKYPVIGKYILSLGFDDIYRSFLFIGSLGVLCFSTIFCILMRFKATYNRLVNRLKNVTIAELKSLEVKKEISPDSIKFREKYFNFERIDEDGTKISLHTFGTLSLAGGMILHIGLLLILAGGYMGLVSGVETVIHGREGDRVPIPPLNAMRAGYKADKISRKARYIRDTDANAPILDKYRKEVEMLHKTYAEGITAPDFSVFFEKLSIDYYKDDEGKIKGIKSWNSAVSFIKNGEEKHKSVVKVNEPVTFGDYTFFQANWRKYYPTVRL